MVTEIDFYLTSGTNAKRRFEGNEIRKVTPYLCDWGRRKQGRTTMRVSTPLTAKLI